MADSPSPQIYLITPPEAGLGDFPDLLARVLDSTDVACVRLALSSRDQDHVSRLADRLRALTHERDVALVIDSHVGLVGRLGLDGVHLNDGARSVRKVRKSLGRDAIVGAFCGTSRHDGMNAGEAGADYISFGPVGASLLGDGSRAETALFAWWSEMIELPVVAEGALDEQSIASLSQVTDFIALGAEIWDAGDPVKRLRELVNCLG